MLLCTAALSFAAIAAASGQTIIYSRGQNVAPAFEGWERNPDGTFSLWFGYMNRNMDEKLHIPVGPDNRVEPGHLDAGQPTFFHPRRNRYVFQVTVPADFGDGEVVWTVNAHGKTGSAYGSLRVDYVVDGLMKMMDIGGLGVTDIERKNQPPVVAIEGDARRMVRVGEPLRSERDRERRRHPGAESRVVAVAGSQHPDQGQLVGPAGGVARVSRAGRSGHL